MKEYEQPITAKVLDTTDRAQLREHGIDVDDAVQQLQVLRNPPEPIVLERPCTVGDGILTLSDSDLQGYAARYEPARLAGRATKFIPASGAATRMFRVVRACRDAGHLQRTILAARARAGHEDAVAMLELMNGLPQCGFYPQLQTSMAKDGLDVDQLRRQGDYTQVADYLLTAQGLDYGSLPKGLVPFHAYADSSRTALEEHLVEGVEVLKDAEGICRFHVTVPRDQRGRVERFVREIVAKLAKARGCVLRVQVSAQHPASDTLALDEQGLPFRLSDGRLLFRPGGHGALLRNLNALRGDLVCINNIDNIAPEWAHPVRVVWKRALAGVLLEIQEKLFAYLAGLAKGDRSFLEDARQFLLRHLSREIPSEWSRGTAQEQREMLREALNRPLRVCGVIKQHGGTGGGPFWVREPSGGCSLQIVENAQVEHAGQTQQTVHQSATHFNPVELVCGMHDWRGRSFDLAQYVDRATAFLTDKTQDGRALKALEHPGLWNGSMAGWHTVFVEVPPSAYTPVKTVNDLLGDAHQPR